MGGTHSDSTQKFNMIAKQRRGGFRDRAWYSRGYLPHFEGKGAVQSVTIRLFDSLPQEKLEQFRREIGTLPLDSQEVELRKKLEDWIDKGYGQCFLEDERVATLVEAALVHFDGERYRLHAWCIMPNHVHFLISLLESHSISLVIRSLKSFTARQANRVLDRTGAFWYREYYDRYIRDAKHFDSVRNYIEQNPVKAGLCSVASDWRFGSAWERLRQDCEMD